VAFAAPSRSFGVGLGLFGGAGALDDGLRTVAVQEVQ
jgi:hypothetical protein